MSGRGAPNLRTGPAELIADLERIYARKKVADKELNELVVATATGLLDLSGIGPSGAAGLLGPDQDDREAGGRRAGGSGLDRERLRGATTRS